jgi:excisionase family DNA binding protein
MLQKLLNSQEVAALLGISRSQAYNLMRNGEIPSIRLRSSIRVAPAALEKYLLDNAITNEPTKN